MDTKRWTLKTVNEEEVKHLQEHLRINSILCRALVCRGISTFEEARTFFRPSAEHLHDPFLMKGMHQAVERIHQGVQQNEKLLIYGDYDVDGTTSVALVFRFFSKLTASIEYYIPHRFTEGYGLSKAGVDYAIEQGIQLIITLDCGIKSIELIDYAAQHGIDVIVCDHHLPDDILPPALAILNPKQSDCTYPYKELCGCGIGFKLISAYAKAYQIPETECMELMDLLATAIAADIVPMNGENRTLSVLGLKKANENPSIPLKALKKIAELNRDFSIHDLVFVIAPRVNAAGRMDNARKAVDLFLSEKEEDAITLAEQLHENNNDRKDVDRSITEEALELLSIEDNRRSTVLYQPHWHKGVVGIVASRLIDHRYRPTIILTSSNGMVTGSARSIKGFNLYEGLSACAEHLENYGGHYFAAGLTLREENLEEFREKFEQVVCETLAPEFFLPEIEIDSDLSFPYITNSMLDILQQFAPHGPENLKPVFRTKNVTDYRGLSTIVKDKHIRFLLQHEGKTFSGIGFNLCDKIDIVKSGRPFQILYHIEENVWQGQKSIQLKVLDLQP